MYTTTMILSHATKKIISSQMKYFPDWRMKIFLTKWIIFHILFLSHRLLFHSVSVCVDKITFYGWIKRRCIISMINLVIFCKMEFSSFILLLLFWELKIFVSKKYLTFNSAGRCGSSSETLISKQSCEQAGRLLMWL